MLAVPIAGGGGQAVLCGVGYGSLAHLANDPRVNPRAWQEGNDVDGSVPATVHEGAGAKLAAAGQQQQLQQQLAGTAGAAVPNAAGCSNAAAVAPQAPAGQLVEMEEANVAVSARALCTVVAALHGWHVRRHA